MPNCAAACCQTGAEATWHWLLVAPAPPIEQQTRLLKPVAGIKKKSIDKTLTGVTNKNTHHRPREGK